MLHVIDTKSNVLGFLNFDIKNKTVFGLEGLYFYKP